MASNGTHSTLVWTGFPDAYGGHDREEIYAVSGSFDDLGEAVPRVVTAAPNSQIGPSIAWNGEVFLAAW